MRSGARFILSLSFVAALLFIGASPARAQESFGDLNVSFARLDYDLAGTGNAPALAVRTTHSLTSNVRLEVGALFAKPEQRFGPSTLFAPEAQLQYRWNIGRVAPYVGGGIGAALVKTDFASDWDPTYSVAGGAAVRLTERLAATGELRIRVHEWRGAGTTTEISAGLAWRLPSF
jgi:opacity protein-like surface antigen